MEELGNVVCCKACFAAACVDGAVFLLLADETYQIVIKGTFVKQEIP